MIIKKTGLAIGLTLAAGFTQAQERPPGCEKTYTCPFPADKEHGPNDVATIVDT
jgi:hypothetical protein